MKNRRLIMIGFLLIVAVVFAPLAFTIFESLVIEPLSYLNWVIRVVLRAIPQSYLWLFLVTIVLLIALGSMLRNSHLRPAKEESQKEKQGPVEVLAQEIFQSKRGDYFKWVVANRLAKLAQALILQDGDQPSKSGHQIKGQGWDPPQKTQSYLEAGLRDSIIK